MKYAKHRKSIQKKPFSISIYVILFVLVVVVVGYFFLRKDAPAEVFAEPTDVVEEKTTATMMIPPLNQLILRNEDGSVSATVKRDSLDGLFSLSIVADLPSPESRSVYYEAWLVKPGVVEHFSVGELFARADGKWGLLYELREDKTRIVPMEYTRLIITKEERDGNPSPSAEHILEGQF